MKLLAHCGFCTVASRPATPVVIGEDFHYTLKCPDGHETTMRLFNPHFELLFDAAALAILDGYYREAVINAASSMERFHEFFVRFVCFLLKRDFKKVDGAWKDLKFTERQLGAFVACHLIDAHERPKLISSDLINLRNLAVHEGKFVSHEQATKYVTAVHDNIILHLKDTNQRHPGDLTEFHVQRLRNTPTSGFNVGSNSHLTIIRTSNVATDTFGKRPFSEGLEEMRSYRAGFYP
jgi:hypothetical protein